MDIGFKLKKLREKFRFSQENVAVQLNISQSKLCDIENGRRKKDIEISLMNKICEIFKIDYSYFIYAEVTSKGETDHKSINFDDILEKIQLLIKENSTKDILIKELKAKLDALSHKKMGS